MAENRLATGIKLANQQIFEASVRNEDVHGMGTTVVVLGTEFDPANVRQTNRMAGDPVDDEIVDAADYAALRELGTTLLLGYLG